MKEFIVIVEQKSFTRNLRICEEGRGWKLEWDVDSKYHGGGFGAAMFREGKDPYGPMRNNGQQEVQRIEANRGGDG